jgi:predicted transcriptional regulator
MNPKLDHSLAYRIMMSEIRRDLLKYIGNEIRDIKDIQKEFQLNLDQLEYHLSMLKQGLYVMDSDNKWKATPRGLGFLANAIMG